MTMLTGVRIGNSSELSYFDAGDMRLKRKLTVIVDTDRGLEFGTVELVPFLSNDVRFNGLNKVVRIASKSDYLKNKKNIRDAREAF